MNIGSIVRSANAFAAETVHIVGRKRWNKRGAMVTDRYQHIIHHDDVAKFVSWARAEALPIIAIDNVPGSVIIETFALPERCVLLFGQEGPGLSAHAIERRMQWSRSANSAAPEALTPQPRPPSPCTPGSPSTWSSRGLRRRSDGAEAVAP